MKKLLQYPSTHENDNEKIGLSFGDYKLVKFCLFFLLNVSVVSCIYEEYKKPSYLEGRVGGYTVFNCE